MRRGAIAARHDSVGLIFLHQLPQSSPTTVFKAVCTAASYRLAWIYQLVELIGRISTRAAIFFAAQTRLESTSPKSKCSPILRPAELSEQPLDCDADGRSESTGHPLTRASLRSSGRLAAYRLRCIPDGVISGGWRMRI